jgi:hypothetical protein
MKKPVSNHSKNFVFLNDWPFSTTSKPKVWIVQDLRSWNGTEKGGRLSFPHLRWGKESAGLFFKDVK